MEPALNEDETVILDVAWFCRDILGAFFKPQEHVCDAQTVAVDSRGRVSQEALGRLLFSGASEAQIDGAVSVLKALHLCFLTADFFTDDDKSTPTLTIPGLITRADTPLPGLGPVTLRRRFTLVTNKTEMFPPSLFPSLQTQFTAAFSDDEAQLYVRLEKDALVCNLRVICIFVIISITD